MTVGQLIEQLQKLPQDLEVKAQENYGSFDDWYVIGAEVKDNDTYGTGKYVQIKG
jgi:hypothetical protein